MIFDQNYHTKMTNFKFKREMLMNSLRVMINNSFKESFYEKKINILTTFSISHIHTYIHIYIYIYMYIQINLNIVA